MKQAVAVAVLVACVCVSQAKQFPSFVKKCKRNDPELNECMKNALLEFRKYLTDGVKELKIPSLNPYELPNVTVHTSWMNGTCTNFKIYNCDNYEVDYIDVDLDENRISLNLTLQYLEIHTHYVLDGRLLQFILHGEGEMEANMTNTKTRTIMDGHKVQKDGKEYLILDNIDFQITNHPVQYFYFHDLFKDNPELTQRVHEVLWENLNQIDEEIFGLIDEVVSAITLSIFKGTFDNYPLDELFN